MNPSASHAPAPDTVPRGMLIAAGSLVAFALALATAVRIAGLPIDEPEAPVVATRALRFQDQPDGSVLAIDARRGALVARIQGEQGFLRGTLRGLARERRRESIDAGPPFLLVRRSDGRLELLDPSTSRRVDLQAFGATNALVFARLLAPGGS